ncbi:hypothetical protein ACH5RR_022132 [Cinchona calisaya]|uniref:Transmembrane protein 45B n=1 Tax=Cinchona calisaya TaxID=153742 RepID=A0ABD2ZA80_9GENT
MGTFVGHLIPGLALACLGLWHAFNTVRAYCINGSAKFTSRFWYPFRSPICRLKSLELILLLSFSIFAIFMQILDFPFLHLAFKLDNFEHATMFLHLAIFSGFTLFAELSHSSEILSGVSGILATSVFAQELFLLHYHSTDHIGLEGHYHWLLQLIVWVSLLSALVATICPSSFPAALVLSVSVLLQGCWFMIMGFMLWVPEFIPQGCLAQLNDASSSSLMRGAVICQTHEASFRARALANLQFSWILSAVLIFVAGICLNFSRTPSPRVTPPDYEQLHSRAADVPLAIWGFKQTLP